MSSFWEKTKLATKPGKAFELLPAPPAEAALKSTTIFKPLKLNDTLTLKTRVAMSPMTRFRATDDLCPVPGLQSAYYGERAEGGPLIITEATVISEAANGFPNVPGIFNDKQIAVWKESADAVHAQGGLFFIQLWAHGRTAVPSVLKATGHPLLGPSVVYPSEEARATAEQIDWPLKEMTQEDIDRTVQEFTQAARNAIAAGADGVEIHGANGYLVHQFLDVTANQRSDKYGGSIENRARFALEIVDAVSAAVGGNRVALRISPWSDFNGIKGGIAGNFSQFVYLAEQLEIRARADPANKLAYLALVEAIPPTFSAEEFGGLTRASGDVFYDVWSGAVVRGSNLHREPLWGKQLVEAHPDRTILSFGRIYISNPDLVHRLQENLPFTFYNRDGFYSVGKVEGYLGYPKYEEIVEGKESEEEKVEK